MIDLYYIILFAGLLFAGLFLFIYMLYKHFVQKLELQQKESIRSILEMQENERRTIALEVHDNLGPLLSISNMHIEALIGAMENESTKEGLQQVHKQLKDAIFICRNISHELAPFLNSDISLQEMISDYTQKINSTGKLLIVFQCDIGDIQVQRQKSASICRILLELITNTMKHAQAKQVTIDMVVSGTIFILSYMDNGIGIQAAPSNNNGIGMKNIQSRIQLLNGQLQTGQEVGKGFSLKIKIPVKELI